MRDYTIEERAYFWLSLVDSMPIGKKYELIDDIGSVAELYLSFVDYADRVIEIAGNQNFARLTAAIDSDYLDRELEKMDALGIDFVTIDSRYYPDRLRHIDEPPLLLYYKGNVEVLAMENMLAVVGTRAITRYGKDITKSLVEDIARAGIVIVSGLARGVDTYAHRATLAEDGITIAVVANGLESCYPSENHELLERILLKGAVISEYPIGSTPYAYRFPERNRIISGMSKGVLVTEAGRHSGSLITLNLAVDQGKDVYIVPGNINSTASQGSNDAIKEMQGAMITCSEDVISAFDVESVPSAEGLDIELNDIESKIVNYVREDDRHIDEIVAYLGDIKVSELLAILSKLELLGLVQRLPQNYYGK